MLHLSSLIIFALQGPAPSLREYKYLPLRLLGVACTQQGQEEGPGKPVNISGSEGKGEKCLYIHQLTVTCNLTSYLGYCTVLLESQRPAGAGQRSPAL